MKLIRELRSEIERLKAIIRSTETGDEVNLPALHEFDLYNTNINQLKRAFLLFLVENLFK